MKKIRFKKIILVSFALLLVRSATYALTPHASHVKVQLVSDVKSIQPGQPFWVGAHLKMDRGWHTYYKDPGEVGQATRIKWTLPQGFKAGEIQWQTPQKIESAGIISFGYEGEALLLTQIDPPKNLAIGKSIELKAHVDWLECEAACVPGQTEVELRLNVEQQSTANPDWVPRFEMVRNNETTLPSQSLVSSGSVWVTILLAFLGGFLLNLMPCVLPVLSIKILGFIKQSYGHKNDGFKMGISYTFGVLVSFWIFALAILFLQTGGEKLGWGFQLQYPLVVAILSALFFILGLNLLGVFEIGNSLVARGGAVLAGKQGVGGSFLSGILATVVASPCTAPFMGSALGVALTQEKIAAFGIFTSLGLGMASPYLACSLFPGLLKYLPNPGSWMETFKQLMGFLFMATVVWLLWVYSRQRDSESVIVLLSGLLVLGIAAWIYGRWGTPLKTAGVRFFSIISSVLLVILTLCVIISTSLKKETLAGLEESSPEGIQWSDYSPSRVQALHQQGVPVFIDFTAAWCLTCQVNKKTTFSSQAVIDQFKSLGIIAMKADWTNRDDQITQAIHSYGRNGVPVYVLFGRDPQATPRLLPELLTPVILLKELDKI